ncbi:MAG: FHA domain-containing protein [Candidatus Eremiobacteraeota bacterium]|nr:FHA domain-containing protein [Candidatus Eremiobacteraeota bacterium]MCW5867346.1 FHA domain-containing protein [Candidatus Eremiobacteraeota bacterium]
MSNEEEATQAVSSLDFRVANAYLELHLLLADGSERWLSFGQESLPLDPLCPEGEGWTAQVSDQTVHFASTAASLPCLWQGHEVREAVLHPGESLELGATRIWLVDARRPELASLDSLEGMELPRHWPLRPQAYRMGRRTSSRHNHLEIPHPTVSRAQATLLPAQGGRFALLAESNTSPTAINGRRLEWNEIALLHHGDLIKVGQVSLRFRQTGHETAGKKILTVKSLGGFQVQWGELMLAETAWKVEKAGWLLARLAWAWGQPVSVDLIMEMLWPELPALRGRKNLSQCLGGLKQTLQLQKDEEELLLRTPASLQLNPSLLAEHDAYLVKRLADGQEAAGWSKALDLYQGPFLPGNFTDWAELIRQELHGLVVDCAVKLSAHHSKMENWNAAVKEAQRGLVLDPCHEGLALQAMEANLHQGRSDQAVRCFEMVRKQLQTVLGVEPGIELLRLYHRAKLEP